MKKATFQERIDCVLELGYLAGVNSILRSDKSDLVGLYRTEGKEPLDDYMFLLYNREYQRGKQDRSVMSEEKVIPIGHDFISDEFLENVNLAFDYGKAARGCLTTMNWIADKKFLNFLEDTQSEIERRECINAWISGYTIADEKIREVLHKEPETILMIDYDRVDEIYNAYRNGEEPDPGTAASEAYQAYVECIDLFKNNNCEQFIRCLACPDMFKIPEEFFEQEGSTDLSYCDEDCTFAYRAIAEICGKYRDRLEAYFVVEVPVDEVF